MTRIQIACALTIFTLSLNSCSTPNGLKSTVETVDGLSTPSFDGDWRGLVKCVAAGGGADTNYRFRLRIVINGDTALAYELKNKKWAEIADESTGSVKYTVSKMQDTYVITWLNHWDPWTEEQTYSLSYINPSKIRVIQLRHVTNRDEGKNGKPWFYVCDGVLTKAN